MLRTIRLMLSCALIFCAVSHSTLAAAKESGKYQLYFLGGQSNMEGFGYNDEIPSEWLAGLGRVMIFTGQMAEDNSTGGGIGRWEVLQPGHGRGFSTDGKINALSNRFGPELAFGKRMSNLEPTARIAIIKYSRGGTSLQESASGYGTWAPDFDDGAGMNQYDYALATIQNALSQGDIDGDGVADMLVPAGIIWMQGESDAYHSRESAEAYRDNLKRMMDLLRAALRVDDLPVVIGKITDSGQDEDGSMMDYIEIVQQAQAEFVARDRCAALVTVTDKLAYSEDKWHYDSQGFIELGASFADAAFALKSECLP